LSGHDHVIDCIAWAGIDAARTIDGANYSGHQGNSFVENAESGMLNDENGMFEESKEESKEIGEL